MSNIHSKEYRSMIQKLITARNESGLSQVQVAKELSKPQSYVSKCESGERRIDVIELNKFAKIYKKNLNCFVE